MTQMFFAPFFRYPVYEIQHAVEYHYSAVAALYKDVLANTENSVDGLEVCSRAEGTKDPRGVKTDGPFGADFCPSPHQQIDLHYSCV